MKNWKHKLGFALAVLLIPAILYAQYAVDHQASVHTSDPAYTGTGLNDLTVSGTFTGSTVRNFEVEIDATGTPDTFKWSKNGGLSYEATGVEITGSAQELTDGISITFGATTGHTSGGKWKWQSKVVSHLSRMRTSDGKHCGTVTNDGEVNYECLTTMKIGDGFNMRSGTSQITLSGATDNVAINAASPVPNNAVLIGTNLRLDTAITGGGGADRVGIGDNDCTDPDGITETTALTANTKVEKMHSWSVNSGQTIFKACAMTDASTGGGTIGASGEKMTFVWLYLEPRSLMNYQ